MPCTTVRLHGVWVSASVSVAVLWRASSSIDCRGSPLSAVGDLQSAVGARIGSHSQRQLRVALSTGAPTRWPGGAPQLTLDHATLIVNDDSARLPFAVEADSPPISGLVSLARTYWETWGSLLDYCHQADCGSPKSPSVSVCICVCIVALCCAYFTRPWETDLSCVSHTLDGWLDCDAIRWIAEMLLLLLLVDFKRVDCQPAMGGSGRSSRGGRPQGQLGVKWGAGFNSRNYVACLADDDDCDNCTVKK